MDKFYDPKGKLYIRPLTEPIEWRISVYGLAEKDGKVLLVKPTWVDRWDLPGGGIEIDETIKEGLTREFSEETGIKPKVIDDRPIYVTEQNFYWKACMDNRKKDRFCHSIVLIYKVQAIGESLDNFDRKEIKEISWIDVDSLNEKECQPIIWPVINELKI